MPTLSAAKSGFAPLKSHQLYYKIRGTGPRLMIITGTNTDTRYKPTVYQAPGADKFELLNFDHRGMGQSNNPDEIPTMESYANDVIALLDYLGWQDTAIIGVSFGGMVAQHIALRHPDRVKKIVLCCTSSGGNGGSSYPLHELQHLSAEGLAEAFVRLMNKRHDALWQAENPKLYQEVYNYYWQSTNATLNNPEKRAAMDLQFAARATHNVYDQLNSLAVPTLVACGKDDGVAPVSNSEALADIIPDARLKLFDGGHSFLKEDPESWPAIFNFLKDYG